MTFIEAPNVNAAYPQAIHEVMYRGNRIPSRVAETYEQHPAWIKIRKTSERLVTAFGRPINVPFALAEVVWILGGQRDVETLKFYNKQIGDYSDDGTNFNAAYGYRLRHAHGHDQIYDAIKTLQNDPDSRQVVLNLNLPSADRGWRPVPSHNGGVGDFIDTKHTTKDRACNVMALLKIRNGRLDWMQIVRSNDAMWGTPYNWMQFLHLQAFIAAAIGVEPGEYNHMVDSLHIYDYHWDAARRIRPFDLYKHSSESEHIPFTVEDTTEETLSRVLATEYAIRSGTEPLPHVRVPGGGYWTLVLEVLQAHWCYTKNLDTTAYAWLAGGDPIYGAATMRHYYYWRWHKPEYQELVERMRGDLLGSIFDWVTDSHYQPGEA